MIARWVFAVAVVGLVACSGRAAADDPPGKKADPTAALLDKLRQPCGIKGGGEIQITELADLIEEKHGVSIVINEAAFAPVGLAACRIDFPPVKLPKAKGLSVSTVLRHCLSQVQATYLVRKGYLEVVPVSLAIKQTKNTVPPEEEDGSGSMRVPLVSAIYKDKPLNEAVADLAEEFDLTVIVAGQAGDAKAAFVTARLLNVPADDALDLLAAQADLRVVRQGKSYLLTSPDHANALFEEQMNKEQRKIELERLRNTPLAPPGIGGLGVQGINCSDLGLYFRR